MRRALLAAVPALLIADASGITSILVPKSCTISAGETRPDGGCSAFCVRRACASCVSPVFAERRTTVAGEAVSPDSVSLPSRNRLPTGNPLDIFHVPKTAPDVDHPQIVRDLLYA